MATKAIRTPEDLNYYGHIPDVRSKEVSYDKLSEEKLLSQGERLLALGRAVVLASQDGSERSFGEAIIKEDKIIEERRSAHMVGFGTLIGCEKNYKGKNRKYSVAYKPFNNAQDALSEVKGYLTLEDLGVETYEPIGVYPSVNKEHYIVVTKKRSDLKSLDTDSWVVGRKVTDEATNEISQRNTERVKGIASLLAYIHSNGVFHPDGQIKNFAVTPEGEIGIIDTENLVKVEIGEQSEADRAWYDIEKLVKSLIANTKDNQDATLFGVGMLHGMPLEDVRQCLEELVITPYINSLLEELGSCDDGQAKYVQNLYDGIQRHFEEKTWPIHLIN